MGTVVQTFEPLAGYNTGSFIAELYVPSSGPTLTPGWAFTAPSPNLEICFPSQAVNYGGGNATIQIDWYCPAATSGTATWIAKVIAVTPGDAESVEASDNATSTTSSATTVNGTAGGLTRTTISVSALDSLAAGDKLWIKLRRDTADTSIAQTIYLTEMMFSYGDGLTGTPGSGDVVGPASSVAGRVATYADATGKLLASGTRLETDMVEGPPSSTVNALVRFATTGGTSLNNSVVLCDASGNLTGVGTLNTRTIANLVDGPASATSGRVAVYNGATGKLIQDGTKLEADLVTGPASVAATSNIAVYNGTTGKIVSDGGQTIAQVLAAAGDVDGPGSSTSGRIATFNGATGKIIQDGGVLGSDLIVGPASSVSGNVLSFNGTTGKLAQDSGVSATAHAARHNPAGADAMFTGTWAAGDAPVWNGTIWVPKSRQLVELSATQVLGAAAANTFVNITNLTIAIPRAGTYKLSAECRPVSSGTNGNFFVSFGFSGTVTRISASGVLAIAGGAAGFHYIQQNAAGTTAATTFVSSTVGGAYALNSYNCFLIGTLVCSTTGNVTLRAARVSATSTTPTITFQLASSLAIEEV